MLIIQGCIYAYGHLVHIFLNVVLTSIRNMEMATKYLVGLSLVSDLFQFENQQKYLSIQCIDLIESVRIGNTGI